MASEKIFRFAKSQVFESEIAGILCADMCACVSKVSARVVLGSFSV